MVARGATIGRDIYAGGSEVDGGRCCSGAEPHYAAVIGVPGDAVISVGAVTAADVHRDVPGPAFSHRVGVRGNVNGNKERGQDFTTAGDDNGQNDDDAERSHWYPLGGSNVNRGTARVKLHVCE